jgi:hypothetical protein
MGPRGPGAARAASYVAAFGADPLLGVQCLAGELVA